MKKQYLISMTAFVMVQNESFESRFTDSFLHDEIGLEIFKENVSNYAEFLSQKNELGFFVPCDKNGNVLSEPNEATDARAYVFKYEKAKERVLFKNAKFDRYGKLYCGGLLIGWINSESKFYFQTELMKSIERLVIYSKTIELTESAIKKIGLE